MFSFNKNNLSWLKAAVISCLISLWFSEHAYSAEVAWTNRSVGNAIRTSNLTLIDGDRDILIAATKVVSVNTTAYVRLGLAELASIDYLGTEMTVRVTYTLTTYDAALNTTVTTGNFVEAKYSPLGLPGATTGIEIDASDYRMTNVNYFTIAVTSVSINGFVNTATVLPNFVYLEAGIQSERYYALAAPQTAPNLNVNFLTYSPSTVSYQKNNQTTDATISDLELTWSYVRGAEEYDVEWTWIDNYSTSSPLTPLPATSLSLSEEEFSHNSTRARTKNNTIRLPNIYARGYIIYRVRAIGRWMEDYTKEKVGAWTSDAVSNKTTVDQWPHKLVIGTEHEGAKNWQVQVTYAEDGKKKEVVQYFDGSLRNRQTLTRLNSLNKTVVGETIYDNEGRGVVQVLPVPLSTAGIKYVEKLNQNTTGQAFSYKDFDLQTTSTTSCVSTPSSRLNTASGAGNYYSTTGHSTDKDWQRNVPDAQGYAYTQVEYTPDNTGRVRNQSGVGETHQLGGDHATVYYYSTPSQEELNRLFGYKVGYAARYKKNMVVDANGQVSVSYLDAQGRVVATALAGNNPEEARLMALDSEKDTQKHTTTTVDVLSKLAPTDADTPEDKNNLLSTGAFGALNDGLSLSTQVAVSSPQPYTFDYIARPDVFTTNCAPTPSRTYSFTYDVVLSLKDDCGNEYYGTTLYNVGIEGVNTLNDTDFISHLVTPELKKGTYTLSKKLTVNAQSVEHYWEDYLQNSGCVLPSTAFTEEANDDCDFTCQECVDALGTEASYIAARQALVSTPLSAAEITTITAQYAQERKDCVAPCELATTCDATFSMLLDDVSPLGQYGLSTDSSFLYYAWNASITNYLNADGTAATVEVTKLNGVCTPAVATGAASGQSQDGTYFVSPKELTLAAFIQYFQPEWANALVKFHPEHRLYDFIVPFCTNKEPAATCVLKSTDGQACPLTSEEFDNLLREQASTYTAAKTGASISTDGGLTFKTIKLIDNLMATPQKNLNGIDPFFKINYPLLNSVTLSSPSSTTTFSLNTLKSQLIQEQMDNYVFSGTSLLKRAVAMVLFPNDQTQLAGAPPALSNPTWASLETYFGSSSPTLDAIWMQYTSLYAGAKNKVKQFATDIYGYSLTPALFNGAIGSKGTNVLSILEFAPSGQIPVPALFWPIIFNQETHYNPVGGNAFESKTARVPRTDQGNSGSNTPEAVQQQLNQANYQTYEETGLCPVANDLLLFLGLSKNGKLAQPMNYASTPEITPAFFGRLVNNGAGTSTFLFNPGDQLTVTPTFGAGLTAPLSLAFQYTDNGISATKTFTFSAPVQGANTLPWATYNAAWKVYDFYQLWVNPAQPTQAKVIFKAGTTAATATEYIVTITSPYALNTCVSAYSGANIGTLDMDCKKDEIFAGQLLSLIQAYKALETSSQVTISSTSSPTLWSVYNGSSIQTMLENAPVAQIKYTYLSGYNTVMINNMNNSRILSFSIPSSVNLFSTSATINALSIIQTGGAAPTMNVQTTSYSASTGVVSQTVSSSLQLQNVKSPLPIDFSCPCSDVSKEKALENFFNNALTQQAASVTTYSNPSVSALAPLFNINTLSVVNLKKTLDAGVSLSGELTPTNATNPNKFSFDLTVKTSIVLPLSISSITFYTPFHFKCVGTFSDGSLQPMTGMVGKVPQSLPYCECPVSLLPPTSCEQTYTTYLNLLGTTGSLLQSTPMQKELYCFGGYSYLLSAYQNYIQTMGVTSTASYLYVRIQDFALSALGLDSNLYAAAISSYNSSPYKQTNTFMPFVQWVNEIYTKTIYTTKICPPTLPHREPPYVPVAEPPCNQMEQNVALINAQTSYGLYLEEQKKLFIGNYLSKALSSIVETFNQSYTDKEYHYTLYYYDRAGNLVQTVPPKGVDRIKTGTTEGATTVATEAQINQTRSALSTETLSTVSGLKQAPNHTMVTNYRYNSLNQLVWQKTPDGGESRFAYDRLGRLIMSQNAKQAAMTPTRFSYTKYDALGRVVEVGELQTQTTQTFTINDEGKLFLNGGLADNQLNDPTYPDNISYNRYEVTRTIYDELLPTVTVNNNNNSTAPVSAVSLFGSSYQALATRNRIVGVVFQDVYTAAIQAGTYQTASFYDYDIHGNVKQLLQVNNDPILANMRQNVKKLNYEYDLVSGNVNKVTFQKGQADQFIHRYRYDDDNRITQVETSKDDYYYERDAKYFYYDHGPLARTELGHKKVQALDYAYTVQGWLKAVNGEEVLRKTSLGQDGVTGTPTAATNSNYLNAKVAADVFGFSLMYFQGDYASANTEMLNHSPSTPVELFDLYNGNIRSMLTAISDLNENNGQSPIKPHQTVYQYDQLNRIKTMQGFYRSMEGETFQESEYASAYSYDENGNLMNMVNQSKAADGNPRMMDNFTYNYLAGTNKLTHVNDDEDLTPNFTTDIDNQSENNYDYDAIGQLLKDDAEKIEEIKWTVTNKVKSIQYAQGPEVKFIEFSYDPMGHRVMKKVIKPGGDAVSTYYVLDAQGNQLATYTHKTINPTNLYLSELEIYGSSRLGTENRDIAINTTPPLPTVGNYKVDNAIGDKRYELSNHLGNVLNVITDRKLPINNTATNKVDYYTADVVAYNDYMPFGALMEGRHGYEGKKTRYGLSSMEQDDEVKGEGNSYNFGARIYDPRLGLWLSTDPCESKYPQESPYNYSHNSPLFFKDPGGKDPVTGVIDAVTAFAIEATFDFVGNLLDGMDPTTALSKVDWGGAVIEGLKSYAISFFFTGAGTIKAFKKLATTVAGRVTSEAVINLTFEILKKVKKGDFDTDGEFDISKLMTGEVWADMMQDAIIEALVSQGMSKKADKIQKQFEYAKKQASKQRDKLAKKVAKQSSEKTINNAKREVKDAAKRKLKKAVKYTGEKLKGEATESTTQKSTPKISKVIGL